MRLVQNVNQFSNFVENVLPPLMDNEVYFVSLSARNKYLTAEEREFYGLGRTEMFARTLVRSESDWGKAIRSLEGELSTRLTKNGHLFPEKALVVYVNINPSDSVAAVLNFQREMTTQLEQVVKASMRGKKAPFDGFKRADRTLLNCFQTATGTRTYLDVDMDTKDPESVYRLVDSLRWHNVEFHLIETHGGVHALVKRESLNGSGLRLDLLVNELANDCGAEVMINSNGMVPMPGTLQAGFLVSEVDVS